MKKVYICHPLRGLDPKGGSEVERNIEQVTNICKQIAAGDEEVVPISPIHTFTYCDVIAFPKWKAMDYCRALLSSCDELWVFGKWWESEGCIAEMKTALFHDITTRFFRVDKPYTGEKQSAEDFVFTKRNPAEMPTAERSFCRFLIDTIDSMQMERIASEDADMCEECTGCKEDADS